MIPNAGRRAYAPAMDLRSRLERLLGDDPSWWTILRDEPAGDERAPLGPVELVAYDTDARLRGTTDAAPAPLDETLGATGTLELHGALTESVADGSLAVCDTIVLERRSVCAIAGAATEDDPVGRPLHPGRHSDRIALELGPYRIAGSLERCSRDVPQHGTGRPPVAILTDAYIEWTVDGISVRECHAELAVNLELARWVEPARDRADEAIAFPSLGAAPAPVLVAAGPAAAVLVAGPAAV